MVGRAVGGMDLEHLRADYRQSRLGSQDLLPCPFEQFSLWFEQAQAADLLEPNAMTLSTVDQGGQPSARVVLLKSFSSQGFVFYTNYNSRKAQAMAENPQVAASFLWLPLQRQVSLVGTVHKISRAQSAAYFSSRPRSSQIGAWVSPQSQELRSRSELEHLQQEMEARFAEGSIPVPEHWGGYSIRPHRLEFWQGRPSRLHDRFVYLQSANDTAWVARRLAP